MTARKNNIVSKSLAVGAVLRLVIAPPAEALRGLSSLPLTEPWFTREL